MILTYISRFQFKIAENKLYSLPAYGDGFWQKYLDVFDEIYVIGEPVKEYLDDGSMVSITDKRIKVEIIKSIESPRELTKIYSVKKDLYRIIKNSEAVLIKPASNKGIMAIGICDKLNIPYMIEMTGDVRTALQVRKSIIMKLYGGILYKRTVHAIKKCKFGLYVTEKYLQSKYPIPGEMCGCTDAIIPPSNDAVLEERILKIQRYNTDHLYKIGLIGYYHDNNKGIDTAINALGNLRERINFHLIILGVGSEEDRISWKNYSKSKLDAESLMFAAPLPGAAAVSKWIDGIDLLVLPSRSEGFPRAVAEAMSRACPTITSNVCGLAELVSEEWQHEAGDDSALSSLIYQMVTNKEQMIAAAKYNYLKAKNYEFDLLRNRRNAFLYNFKKYSEAITGE